MIWVFGFFYFLPTLNAVTAHNKNIVAIFLLNFFMGWTIIGWFIALIWSQVR